MPTIGSATCVSRQGSSTGVALGFSRDAGAGAATDSGFVSGADAGPRCREGRASDTGRAIVALARFSGRCRCACKSGRAAR